MKKYCVIIGTDRISNEQDVASLKSAGLLGNASSILDLKINMGAKKALELQASNLVYESQYRQLALREWASRDFHPESISLRKFSTSDGALFIVATY